MTSAEPAARDRLALAADVPLEDGVALYDLVREHVGWVKVGLSLFVEHGPVAVERFVARGARVFLDLKLHDIPNTVGLAAERAAGLGVGLLTIHAGGGEAMLRAAMEGVQRSAARGQHPAPRVLAVTVLTSLADADLTELGVGGSAADQVARLGALAERSGVDGLVCSPREARAMRAAHPRLFLCTPGIRPAGSAVGDQARAETPRDAIVAGADLLVVGRPVTQSVRPREVAESLVLEIEQALRSR